MVFAKHGPMTSAECYDLLGWRGTDQRGNIRARVNELVESGSLEERPKRKCTITNKKVYVWGWTGKEPTKKPKDDKIKCEVCNGKGFLLQRRLF